MRRTLVGNLYEIAVVTGAPTSTSAIHVSAGSGKAERFLMAELELGGPVVSEAFMLSEDLWVIVSEKDTRW